jgi:hypothetical protein
VNSCGFEALSDGSASFDPSTRSSWSKNDFSSSGYRSDFVRDGFANHWNLEHCLSSGFFSFSDGIGDSSGLTESDSYASFVISDDNEDGPASGLSTFVRLENFVCSNDSNV